MSLAPTTNSTPSIAAQQLALIPRGPSSEKLNSLLPVQELPQTLQCLDYPLDSLAHELSKFLDSNGWLLHDVKLPPLPNVPPEVLPRINQLLETPKVVHVKLPYKTIAVNLTLKEIFTVLKTKNQLAGGFLRYLLSSKWYIEAMGLLNETLKLHLLQSKGPLSCIDVLPKDIDFRHFTNGGSSEVAAECVVQLIASKIPKNQHTYSSVELCNFIRQKGSAFEDFDKVFTIEDGDLITDAFLLGLDGGDDPDVDLLIAEKLENKNAALSTVQDLWLDLEDSIIPKGANTDGWQSVIDTSCKVIHLTRHTPKAFTTALSAMLKQFRCPQSISPIVFDKLREYCITSKHHASRTLAKLLKMELTKHHEEPSKKGILLTYMAVSYLLRNGYNSETGFKLWESMSKVLHEHDKLVIGDPNIHSQLSAIHQASLCLPFELVDAAIQIQQFICLNRARDKTDLKNGIFLRVNESKYTIMSLFDGAALTLSCNPLAALESLVWYLTQSSQLQDATQRKILIDLIAKFSTNRGYVFENSSPIKEASIIKPLDAPNLLKYAHALLGSQNTELNKLGYQLAVDCYGLTSSTEAFDLMLSFLPDIIAKESDISKSRSLVQFLSTEIARSGHLVNAHQGTTKNYLHDIQDQISPGKDPYDLCIKQLIDSGNEKLCTIAYKILIRKSRGLHPSKKAKSIIRFVHILMDKQPELGFKIVEKHLDSCNFELEDLLKVIEKYIVIRSKSQIVDKEAKKIAISLRHCLDKYPTLKQGLLQFFLKKFKELQDKDISSGYTLMMNIANECAIFHGSDQISGLWLQYCELVFFKPECDIMFVIKIWKDAENLKLWNSKTLLQGHREFLVKFTEKLYSLNTLEADSIAHMLVDVLEMQPYKDENTIKIQQLAAFRTSKQLGENRSQEELTHSVKTLISLLATNFDEAQSIIYQESAKILLEKLCHPHPNNHTYLANLSKARTLVENPYLQKLFYKNPSEFQLILLKCLNSFYNLRKFHKEDSKVHCLLETLFTISFNEKDLVLHHRAVSMLQRFVAFPDFAITGNLVFVLERFLHPVLISMELNGDYVEILTLLCKILPENRIVESNLSNISSLLRNSMKSELTGFTEKVKAVDTLSDTSSNNGEASQPELKHKAKLLTNERYKNIFQCIPLVKRIASLEELPHTERLKFCTFIVDALINLEAFAESIPWIQTLLDLEIANVGKNQSSAQFVLLNAAVELASAEYYEKSFQIFIFLYRRNSDLNSDILSSMVRNTDGFVNLAPRKYAKILQHILPPEKNPLFIKRYTTAITSAVEHLVKPRAQPKDLRVAMKFYETWPDSLQYPFRPLLAQIVSSKDLDLKRRAYHLLPGRVNTRPDPLLYPIDSMTMQDWKENWKLSWRLIYDLWRTNHEEELKLELLNQVRNLVDSDSALVSYLKQISKSDLSLKDDGKDDLRVKALEQLVPLCSELIEDISGYEGLVHELMVFKDAATIAGYDKLRELLDELFISLFGKIRTSDEFFYACVCLKDVFKMHERALSGKPVNLFAALLKDIPKALGERYYEIYLMIDQMIKAFSSSTLTIPEILKIAESVAPYQNDIPQATNWIDFAKSIPEMNRTFKSRIDAIAVRERTPPAETFKKIGKFLVALGITSYVYHRLRTKQVETLDVGLIMLVIIMFHFATVKIPPKRK